MFSGMKTEEFMESEHSGIFRVELVTKNVALGSSGTHFMHMRVNERLCANFIFDYDCRDICENI